jgi:ribosomal protein S18
MADLHPLNTDLLKRFMSGDGKAARIVSRFTTGMSARMQRQLTRSIKEARRLNLL